MSAARARKAQPRDPVLLSLQDVERALGEKAPKWKGRCFEIATAIVAAKLVDGTAVYGHWLGPVHKKSIFYRGGAVPFVQHGWVALPGGLVLDPTRWAFEVVKPYLYCGAPGSDYDEGGNAWRGATRGPPPRFGEHGRTFRITTRIMDGKTWSWVEKYLGIDYTIREAEPGVLDAGQLMWLANTPLSELGPRAAAIYKALDMLDLTALVPHDNYKRVKEGRWP